MSALKKFMPGVRGRQAQHLTTLAAFICAIVASGSTQLPKVAKKMCDGASPPSREKRLSRWINNRGEHCETYFLPAARALLRSLAQNPLVLVVDGTIAGRGCVALYVGVVYRKKVLPIAWTVVAQAKGHLPESVHVDLMIKVQALIPEGAQVVLLGDGEFDGIDLQAVISHWQWSYVCRSAKSTILYWEGEPFRFDDMIPHCERGDDFVAPGVLFTRKKYGPVNAITWWRKDCKEPIHLVTNIESPEEACMYYAKRFRIETFFRDHKSQGFHIHKSHISIPERLSHLLIPACLAYYWVIFLGAEAIRTGLNRIIHRSSRTDLSLFQLGLSLLDFLLSRGLRIPVGFLAPLSI
jgi:hypothetical protein